MLRNSILLLFFLTGWNVAVFAEEQQKEVKPEIQQIEAASQLFGLSFTDQEKDQMIHLLQGNLNKYQQLRKQSLDNSVTPSFVFNPIPLGMTIPSGENFIKLSEPSMQHPPTDENELAFCSVRDLAHFIQTRQITSLELTELYLKRLKQYAPVLNCVVTLTEELALQQARRVDEEIAQGKYRGFLHGIPYGAKDLLSVQGYKTTWGAAPFKDQGIDQNATVINRLEEAGAVLVAKLTLGALAMGDNWYGGMTKNPWDIKQGSSGSSAGSAAATAAGLVAFSIGSETWGSIGSPSARCGVTGFRPSFGRVSRHGAMALSWTMDKIGPICRSAEDCTIVFYAIHGNDGLDPSLIDAPFQYDPAIEPKKLRLGYLEKAFDGDKPEQADARRALETFRQLGFEPVPIQLPNFPVEAISFILNVEAAAAFDELTRSNRDDELVKQERWSWPNIFRAHRLVPAVEYIQANRHRTLLIQEMTQFMKTIDVYIAPTHDNQNNSLVTNMTGLPAIFLPNGFAEDQHPTSLCLIGNLFDEGTLLSVANTYQMATNHHRQHPSLNWDD